MDQLTSIPLTAAGFVATAAETLHQSAGA